MGAPWKQQAQLNVGIRHADNGLGSKTLPQQSQPSAGATDFAFSHNFVNWPHICDQEAIVRYLTLPIEQASKYL